MLSLRATRVYLLLCCCSCVDISCKHITSFITGRRVGRQKRPAELQAFLPVKGRQQYLSYLPAQALACPFCGWLGFTEASLVGHMASAHSDSSHDSQEVICPICASTPGGDPNHLLTWSDFSTHINLEHRSTGQRDLIS
jgi:hypothetical protein